jgi:hypothetical protein
MAYRGCRFMAPLILFLGYRWKLKVNITPPPSYCPKEPRYTFNRQPVSYASSDLPYLVCNNISCRMQTAQFMLHVTWSFLQPHYLPSLFFFCNFVNQILNCSQENVSMPRTQDVTWSTKFGSSNNYVRQRTCPASTDKRPSLQLQPTWSRSPIKRHTWRKR